jgi:3-oxoacyl-[acyl-carrier protein] reductase
MDGYTRFANSPVGRPVVRRLGLPRPVPLRRFTPNEPDLDGPFLIGGGGRLAETARKVLPVGDGAKYRGLVFDGTAIADAAGLVDLYTYFGPTIRSLRQCGRVVVLGTPPACGRRRRSRRWRASCGRSARRWAAAAPRT